MNRRMISKERLAMLALTLMMTGATAFAQGNGMAGINEATKMVSYKHLTPPTSGPR